MIKCKSKYAYGCKCVIDMSSAELIGGAICCDTAEDLNFSREKILTCCEYAEPTDINIFRENRRKEEYAESN